MYTMYVPNPSKTSPSYKIPSQTHFVHQRPVQRYLDDEHWNQPFLQFAEMIVARADMLRLIMQEQTQKLLSSRKLCALLQWATQVTNRSEENLDACAKRAEALSLVINRASQLARGQARGHHRVLGVERANDLDAAARYAHEIASKLDDNMTKGEQPSAGRAFIDQVVTTWYSGELDPSLLDLTQEEAQTLKDFLYVNHLGSIFNTTCFRSIRRIRLLYLDYRNRRSLKAHLFLRVGFQKS
jgi:hypothetical protein